MALYTKAKAICRVTSTTFDDEIKDLIEAGLRDLGVTDIDDSLLLNDDNIDPLVFRALMTYVKMNFGVVEDSLYKRLKASYDEQKAQMITSSNYGLVGDC